MSRRPGQTARRRRRWRLPKHRSSARRHVRRLRRAGSPASGRIDTRRLHRARRASSACCLMISLEHAPPTNPSMRPSGNTIARSPRCAETGARRATTVATANECPSRRSATTCSKRSIPFISHHSRRQRPDSRSSSCAARRAFVRGGDRSGAACAGLAHLGDRAIVFPDGRMEGSSGARARERSSGNRRSRPYEHDAAASVDSSGAGEPGESTPGGCTALFRASSACCRMISREHAPPTNPSMRPSANTIARSPRCADTGARRATTVAKGERLPFAP